MNAAQITRKDLTLLYRDRRTLSVLVALPLAFISILGISTGQLFSAAEQARKYKIAVVNLDQGDLSTKIVDDLRGIAAIEISDFTDRSAAQVALAEDKVHVIVTIGPAFQERAADLEVYDIMHVREGRLKNKLPSLDITVEAGPFLANASELLQIVVFNLAYQTLAPTVVKKDRALALQIEKASRRSKHELEEQLEETPPPSAAETRGAESFSAVIYQMLVPQYTVMFVFFVVNIMARSFIGEREMGTLNRLRLAPITRTGMMIGKTVPFLIISLVQTAILFVAGRLLFGMSWGTHPWLLLPVMFATSVSATSLGLMLATLVRTEAQVSAYGNFIVLVMAGISGRMMPRNWQPEIMQKVGLFTPHAWALIGYEQILTRNVPEYAVVWNCCGHLFLFAAVFFAIGWWRSREMG